MKGVYPRKNKAGEVTSYQVKWRLGGTGEWQHERFDDQDPAGVFREAVVAAGFQWPEGWVKGKGYIDPAAELPEDERYRFDVYARESIESRTGVEASYKAAILKEAESYLFPTFANCDIRSTEHFSTRTVRSWVNQMSETLVWRGAVQKKMSPKTLKNLHGLLSSILEEAVNEEPPLRNRNPCKLTKLPRTDDDGVSDGEDEDMTFLVPLEVQGIVAQFHRPEDKALVRIKYATGLRWGELTALAKMHVFRDPETGQPKVRVSRAWKKKSGGGFYLGKPKSKRSRRTMRITESTWNDFLLLGLEDLQPEDLVIHDGKGGRLPYSTFYDRWMGSVGRSHEAGTLPREKHPTLHDLRHSHAAALISAGRGLTYVQRRLGHESIQTTSDRYGHLLPEADDAAMDIIEATLGEAPRPLGVVQHAELPAQRDGSPRVYAVHLGAHTEGFWDLEHAQAAAAQWELDRGEPARVEAWSSSWWTRSIPGGLPLVRSREVDRVELWSAGPALYAGDGTEHAESFNGTEPVAVVVWEWEDRYTIDLAVGWAEWRPDGTTEAVALGLDRTAVAAEFARARERALMICGLNTALLPERQEEPVTA